MPQFSTHFGTFIAGALLLCAVFFAIRFIYKNKKNRKCGCGGSCDSCPFSEDCSK